MVRSDKKEITKALFAQSIDIMRRYLMLLSRIVLFTVLLLAGHIFLTCFVWKLEHGRTGGTGMFIVAPGRVIDPDSIDLEYEDENHKLRIGELLNKQAEIYETLGVALPTSSC